MSKATSVPRSIAIHKGAVSVYDAFVHAPVAHRFLLFVERRVLPILWTLSSCAAPAKPLGESGREPMAAVSAPLEKAAGNSSAEAPMPSAVVSTATDGGGSKSGFVAAERTAGPGPAAETETQEGSTADPENKARPPSSSAELTERARHLFDAVATGRPELALDFFFPREPFIPLKDVSDPGRYHDELVASYRRDIVTVSRSRRNWDGATFVGFELGTPPKWVAPGHEWNKIGYFRTLDSRLTYEVAGKRRTLAVRTIISWQGRWYVTHFLPLHRKA